MIGADIFSSEAAGAGSCGAALQWAPDERAPLPSAPAPRIRAPRPRYPRPARPGPARRPPAGSRRRGRSGAELNGARLRDAASPPAPGRAVPVLSRRPAACSPGPAGGKMGGRLLGCVVLLWLAGTSGSARWVELGSGGRPAGQFADTRPGGRGGGSGCEGRLPPRGGRGARRREPGGAAVSLAAGGGDGGREQLEELLLGPAGCATRALPCDSGAAVPGPPRAGRDRCSCPGRLPEGDGRGGAGGAPVWEEGREGAVKGRAGRRGEGGGQRFACFEPGTGGCGGLRQAGCQRGEGAGALPISHRYFTPPPVNPTEKTSGSSSSDLGFAGGKFGF